MAKLLRRILVLGILTTLLASFGIGLTYAWAQEIDYSKFLPTISRDEWIPAGTYRKDPPYTIGVSFKFSTIDWAVLLIEETKEYAANCKYIKKLIITDAEGKVSKQIADIEDMITRGVDAICINPMSPTALIPIIDRIYDSGLPVVVFETDYLGDKYSALRTNSNWEFGRMITQALVDKMGGEGNIIVLRGVPGVGPDIARWGGAKDVLRYYPNVHTVAMDYADWAYDKARVIAASMIAANPKIDGIWACGGQMALAAEEELLEAGRPLVPCAGEDYNGLFKFWKEHPETNTGVAPCQPVYFGKLALEAAVNLLEGIPVIRKIILNPPVITTKTLDKYVRPDLPKEVWCNTTLTDRQLRDIYRAK
jgi:ribose transport system substrate-binding protein